jgi:1,4-dihydroxy-2-naphthoyl-CoA hydrolase
MEGIWRAGVTLDSLRARGTGTLVERLGIELTELGPDYLTGTMPVDDRTCQVMRLLHGGASVALAETLGSVAANAANQAPDRALVGLEINANHIRSVPDGGQVTGTARPLHIGGKTQVWNIEIVDQQARLVCVSRLTMAVVAWPARKN